MKVIRTANEMRAWSFEQRKSGRSVGFVPTMGALHEGHASLMRAAAERDGAAVASIFVNPTQFAPTEDFSQYPRTFEADSALAEQSGVHTIYLPDASAMYPEGYSTYVTVENVSSGLCGKSRPQFFRGVATVVTKLFNAVQPDRAYFGQKDAQQCAVIKRMTRDLDLPIEIVEMPIVREADGLAMSSRNRYLNADERAQAVCLSRGLFKARALLDSGERDAALILAAARNELSDVEVDYVELVDTASFAPVARVERPVTLAVAAWVGKARLIDNIKFEEFSA